MITYIPTASKTEIPEIQGYKRDKRFSFYEPRGDEKEKVDSVSVQEQPTQEVTVETPIITTPVVQSSDWSDIKAIIKRNEGFISTAKKSFNEPNPTVGYGFFNTLPDGTKITEGMTLTEQQADKQLDIAISKLSNQIQKSLSYYDLKISPEQMNILIDLGYHGGVGLVDKLLKESNGNTTKIGQLLNRYATRSKYGDTSITKGLEARARRRSEGWSQYPLKAKYGLKLPNILYNI